MNAIEGRHSYEPRAGHGLAHNPFNAIVAPRPIGWIGSRGADGVANLAPYSFFNALAYVPPLIGFASQGRKDSVRNADETGLFSWNLATRPLAERMNASSAAVGAAVDEFALANLATIAGPLTGVPMVAEARVTFECRTAQIVQLKTAAGEAIDNWFVTGEVVAVHIDETLIVDGIYDTAAARPITRGGGPADYFEITEAAKFAMRRPD